MGMDFLRDCKAKLDMGDAILSLEGDLSCGRGPSYRKVRDTHPRGLCLSWHPSNLSGGARSGWLRTQDSWIVSALEEDNKGPLKCQVKEQWMRHLISKAYLK